MRYGDCWAGALIALVGIIALVAGWPLDFWSDFGPGPGFLPAALGAALAIMGPAVALASLRAREASRGSTSSFRKPLVVIGVMAAYLALLNVLGFVVATALFLFTLCAGSNRAGPARRLRSRCASPLGLYLLFAVVLETPLPSGALPWKF